MSANYRSTREVFEEHLRLRQRGALEEDLARNYAADVVLLTQRGVYRGKDGVRQRAGLLRRQLPDARFRFRSRLVDGGVAFLEWTADSARARVWDGVDSFWIRRGQITVQTIHYTVEPLPAAAAGD